MRPTHHIYTAPIQPAHNFVDRTGPGKPMRCRYSPRALRWCDVCHRQRWAKNMWVQVYYDMIRYFCRDKDACKKARKGKR